MNLAYKHLNAKLRVGELTTGQWASVLFGVVLILGWGLYLSPFPPYPTIISAVYVGAIPIVLALLASYAELNVWRYARKALSWFRADGAYLAGAGDQFHGYRLTPDPDSGHHFAGAEPIALDLPALWD